MACSRLLLLLVSLSLSRFVSFTFLSVRLCQTPSLYYCCYFNRCCCCSLSPKLKLWINKIGNALCYIYYDYCTAATSCCSFVYNDVNLPRAARNGHALVLCCLCTNSQNHLHVVRSIGWMLLLFLFKFFCATTAATHGKLVQKFSLVNCIFVNSHFIGERDGASFKSHCTAHYDHFYNFCSKCLIKDRPLFAIAATARFVHWVHTLAHISFNGARPFYVLYIVYAAVSVRFFPWTMALDCVEPNTQCCKWIVIVLLFFNNK